MIVIDASAVVDLLLRRNATMLEARLLADCWRLYAPELLDLEVIQVLRRFVHVGELPAERAMQAIEDLEALPIERYPHSPLLHRIWKLRHNLTAYDAAYVALAEALDVPLLTRDVRLAHASGTRAAIEIV